MIKMLLILYALLHLSFIFSLRSFYATCSKGIEPLLRKEIGLLRDVESVKQASSGFSLRD